MDSMTVRGCFLQHFNIQTLQNLRSFQGKKFKLSVIVLNMNAKKRLDKNKTKYFLHAKSRLNVHPIVMNLQPILNLI